jgi:hypothetical protein
MFVGCESSLSSSSIQKEQYYYVNCNLTTRAYNYLNSIGNVYAAEDVYYAVTTWPSDTPATYKNYGSNWISLRNELYSLNFDTYTVNTLKNYADSTGAATYIYTNSYNYYRVVLIDAWIGDNNLYRSIK